MTASNPIESNPHENMEIGILHARINVMEDQLATAHERIRVLEELEKKYLKLLEERQITENYDPDLGF